MTVYELDPPEINKDEFIIAAKDEKGHYDRGQFSAQPALINWAKIVFNSKVFPYRVLGDLYRHAVQRHLHWLKRITPDMVPYSIEGQVDVINDLCLEEMRARDFQATLDRVCGIINQHISSNDQAQARKFYLRTMREISKMPEGFWRDKYQAYMRVRFGQLIEDAPRAEFKV